MRPIAVQPASLEKLSSLLTETRADRLTASAQWARSLLAGRVVWNINATAHGGGVAEMLQTVLAYARGAGVDTRWLVLDADAAFFSITKRIRNALHGVLAAGSDFGAAQHEHYARVLQRNSASLREVVRPGDIVLLHDPQTAGLVDGIRGLGAQVVWRCHIGRDEPNSATHQGWQFLRRYLEFADAYVFSREQYAPGWLPRERVRVIPPSIDPLSCKNQELDDLAVRGVLSRVGLIADGGAEVV